MENKSFSQPTKSHLKRKAIASLALGLISVIPLVTLVISFIFGVTGIVIFTGAFFIVVAAPIAIIGIITGLLGLKSTKRNLAVAGIILSLIGLGASIYIYIIAVRIGTA